jgi:thymidylate synthase
VMHELMAGWLDAEIGDYVHNVGSLHLYERDLANTTAIPTPDVVEMASLSVPWDGFDDLLGHVIGGVPTGHQGWDAMAATMLSYRLWKDHRPDEALNLATTVGGALGQGLDTWYELLSRRTARAR